MIKWIAIIITIFTLLIAALMLYQPIKYRYLKYKILSPEIRVRNKAEKALLADGKLALPYLRNWLLTPDEHLITRTCKILQGMENEITKDLMPELLIILDQEPSESSFSVGELIWIKKIVLEPYGRHDFKWKYSVNQKVKQNMCLYLLSKSEDPDIFFRAMHNLSNIGDSTSVKTLIKLLGEEEDFLKRFSICTVLGEIGDNLAFNQINEILMNDSDIRMKWIAAVTLANFNDSRVSKALLKARKKGNKAAAIALGWRNGISVFQYISQPEIDDDFDLDIYLPLFYSDTLARWGNSDALDEIITHIDHVHFGLNRYHLDVLNRMPENCPRFDYSANHITRRNQGRLILEWYEKHKEYLAWNSEKRRYYLGK